MRKLVSLIVLMAMMIVPVCAAADIPEVSGDAAQLIPAERDSFPKAVTQVLIGASKKVSPAFYETLQLCVRVFAAVFLWSLVRLLPGKYTLRAAELAGTLGVSILLLEPAGSMIRLGSQTVTAICEYGKLILPVLTAGLASQGGITAAAGLYAVTAFFGALLAAVIEKILLPMLYVFLALSAASGAAGEYLSDELKRFVKWLISWILKTVLMIYTGFLTVTGVVSGSADAMTLKATRLAISGAVPVVGGILSDASEAVLVSAGTVKNAAGIYGLLAVLAMTILPFLKLALSCLMLRATAAISSVLGKGAPNRIISDYSDAAGLMLAMTGTASFLFFISMICFLKGLN